MEEESVTQNVVLGMDVGGTNCRIGLITEDLQVLEFEIFPTEKVFNKDLSASANISNFIKDYLRRNLKDMNLLAVSIGFPSTISRDKKTVIQTPNIKNISDNFDAVDLLEKELNCTVYVNKDTNNLLLYDMNELDINDYQDVCGIYFGTGVGNAVMINGKILTGHNGVASELGHLPVYGNRNKCTCGNIGCLETVISGLALVQLRNANFPQTELNEIFLKKSNTPEVCNFIKGMAQTVALQANIFDPECIILGGGLLMDGYFPFSDFEREIHASTRKPYPEKNMLLKYSHPTQINGVIGAGIYAYKRLKDVNYR